MILIIASLAGCKAIYCDGVNVGVQVDADTYKAKTYTLQVPFKFRHD